MKKSIKNKKVRKEEKRKKEEKMKRYIIYLKHYLKFLYNSFC